MIGPTIGESSRVILYIVNTANVTLVAAVTRCRSRTHGAGRFKATHAVPSILVGRACDEGDRHCQSFSKLGEFALRRAVLVRKIRSSANNLLNRNFLEEETVITKNPIFLLKVAAILFVLAGVIAAIEVMAVGSAASSASAVPADRSEP